MITDYFEIYIENKIFTYFLMAPLA